VFSEDAAFSAGGAEIADPFRAFEIALSRRTA
jgi:hypothetical protein